MDSIILLMYVGIRTFTFLLCLMLSFQFDHLGFRAYESARKTAARLTITCNVLKNAKHSISRINFIFRYLSILLVNQNVNPNTIQICPGSRGEYNEIVHDGSKR